MPEPDWAKVGVEALEILRAKFNPLLKDGGAEAQGHLALVGEQLTKYWKQAQLGDEAAQLNLEWLKSEMRLIIARYAVKANSTAKRVAAEWIEMAATVGSIFLKVIMGT
jgi:hypothetical protein